MKTPELDSEEEQDEKTSDSSDASENPESGTNPTLLDPAMLFVLKGGEG